MLTTDKFLQMFQNDMSLLIRTVIANNPVAVAGNIQAARLNSPNQQLNDPYVILMNLYTRGKYEQLAGIINNVPYLPNTLPPGYNDAFREIISLSRTPGIMRSVVNNETQGNNWWNNINWGDIVTTAGDLWHDYNNPDQQPPPDNTGSDNQPPVTPPDNTLMYVGIGVGALVLLVLIYLATKK